MFQVYFLSIWLETHGKTPIFNGRGKSQQVYPNSFSTTTRKKSQKKGQKRPKFLKTELYKGLLKLRAS